MATLEEQLAAFKEASLLDLLLGRTPPLPEPEDPVMRNLYDANFLPGGALAGNAINWLKTAKPVASSPAIRQAGVLAKEKAARVLAQLKKAQEAARVRAKVQAEQAAIRANVAQRQAAAQRIAGGSQTFAGSSPVQFRNVPQATELQQQLASVGRQPAHPLLGQGSGQASTALTRAGKPENIPSSWYTEPRPNYPPIQPSTPPLQLGVGTSAAGTGGTGLNAVLTALGAGGAMLGVMSLLPYIDQADDATLEALSNELVNAGITEESLAGLMAGDAKIDYSQPYGPQLPPTAQGATHASAAAPAARNIFGADTPAPMPQPERPAEDITSLLNALGLETESDVTMPAAESAQTVHNSTGDWPDYAGMVAEQLMANPFEVPDYGAMMAQHGGLWTPQQVQQAYENARSQAAMNDQRVQQVAQLRQAERDFSLRERQLGMTERDLRIRERDFDRRMKDADTTDEIRKLITEKWGVTPEEFNMLSGTDQETLMRMNFPKLNEAARARELEKFNRDIELLKEREAARPAAGGVSLLSPQAVRNAAIQQITSGVSRSWGMGANAAATRAAVENEVAEIAQNPNFNMAINSAGYRSDSTSLRDLQGAADGLDAFEGSIFGSMELVRESLKNIPDTGIVSLNTFVRWLGRQTGDVGQVAFDALLGSVNSDIARAMVSAKVSGVTLPEGARNYYNDILNRSYTKTQLIAALENLQDTIKTRKVSYDSQIKKINDRMEKRLTEALDGGGLDNTGVEKWDFDASGNLVRISGASSPASTNINLSQYDLD